MNRHINKLKRTLVQALRLCTGRTAHRGSRSIALLFLDHGTWRGWRLGVTPRPLFTSEKDPVPIVQEAGWAPGPVWTGAENLSPQPGFDPRTVRPVASRYTDYAARPTNRHTVYRLHNGNRLLIGLGYGLGGPGLESRYGQEFIPISETSRPDPWPTQPPMQWVPGFLPWQTWS